MSTGSSGGADQQRPCVMVVDDDADIRAMIKLALELKGYRVVGAAGGAQAMQLLADGLRPGLILLDLTMPGMNGWEFRAAQLSEPQLAHIPLLVFTGDTKVTQKVAELKADGFVHKPVGFHSLQAMVERYLK